jgi:hypothetical protein
LRQWFEREACPRDGESPLEIQQLAPCLDFGMTRLEQRRERDRSAAIPGECRGRPLLRRGHHLGAVAIDAIGQVPSFGGRGVVFARCGASSFRKRGIGLVDKRPS